MRMVHHWIDGAERTPSSGRQLDVYNPATGERTAVVGAADQSDVDAAVSAAAKAAVSWSEMSLMRRAKLLFRLHDVLVANQDRLAAAITAEHGKVLSDARAEVDRGIENVQFAAGIPHLLKGSYSSEISRGVDVLDYRQPLGVVAGITPFNFPVMVPLWMIANALACGNTFILKPSEKDPSPSMLMAELIDEAGFPAGVFNVLHGDKVAVDGLLEDDRVAAISFVGSTPVARYIYTKGTANGKRVQALGGAKNHMVVLPDADIDAAADAAVSSAFGSAGERCMAVSVLVAVGDSGDELVSAVKERVERLRVGPGQDPSSEMGPLVTAEHRAKVASYLDSGPSHGAALIADGRSFEPPAGFEGGFWIGPSVLDHLEVGNPAYDDEIFGPVLSVVRVTDLGAAIDLLNRNPFGNGAVIVTQDGGAARRFHHEVSCGMVGVNVGVPAPVGTFSFGGWKSSLFGDTHVQGPEGIHFYTRNKVVTTRWPDSAASRIDLGFPQSS